jgi:hypothetical protein
MLQQCTLPLPRLGWIDSVLPLHREAMDRLRGLQILEEWENKERFNYLQE